MYMQWEFIVVVSSLAGSLFQLVTIPHRPILWYLGLPEDAQIIPITSPVQTSKALVKSPALLGSYLILKL